MPGAGGSSASAAAGTSATTSTTPSVVSSVGSGGAGVLPETFLVTGVVTDGSDPLEGAIVMQAGGAPDFVTGSDGAFSIELATAVPGVPTIVGTKIGYRTNGFEITELPTEPIEIALRFVSQADNKSYVYGNPGTGDVAHDNSTLYCGHCHTTITAQFQSSAHAESARDPLVQDLYAGVSRAHGDQASCQLAGGVWRAGIEPGTAANTLAKCYLGGGVLPDLNLACGGLGVLACDDPALPAAKAPTAFGHCADCHAPAIDGIAGGRDLHDAVGIAFDNGNHCDFCHHVADVDLSKPPGNAGRLVVRRPVDTVTEQPGGQILQAMFGPLPDVPNAFMGGSHQPKFATSELCAGCHEQLQEALVPGTAIDAARWPMGLPTHSTYSEWAASPYNTPSTPCQSCHMPADDTGLVSTVDVTNAGNASIAFGFIRPPEQIRQHIFRGPLEGAPRLLDNAVAVFLATQTGASGLTVDVTLQSLAAGHAIPTGEPMRALVLVVDAVACGAPMTPSGGMTIYDAGGAIATGTVGPDVTAVGATMTWPAGAPLAKTGDVVRVVRATGAHDDYTGTGFFADPLLTPAQKGLPVLAPVGEAVVTSVSGSALSLGASLAVQPGDIVYLGDALVSPPGDGSGSLALAGSAGYAFARTLLDPQGTRGAPHYRAIDIASDNRIPASALVTTTHAFAIPPGCATATVRATLLYRPVPVAMARARGWSAVDYVVETASENVALP